MLDDMTEEHIEYMVERIPMKRLGEPEEVAALIAFLASEAVQLLDRRGVRPVRRSRDVLTRP